MASVASFTLAIAILFTCSVKGQYLLLSNELSGQVLFCAATAPNGQFAISFIHSVNKSPVTEYYHVDNGQIYLDSLRYYTFGAGMPSELEPGQFIHYEDDGAMIIEGFDRPMFHLVYNIGRVAGHTLHWQGQDIPLNTLDAPGQPVLFSVIIYPRLWMALYKAGFARSCQR